MLLHHIATGGALELAQLAAAQERQRRLGGELLGQLLDRRIDPRAAESQIADLGLDLPASMLAAVRAGPDGQAVELDRRLALAQVPHLLLRRGDVLYVGLPQDAVAAHLLAARSPGLAPAARHDPASRGGSRRPPRRSTSRSRRSAAAGRSPRPGGCRTRRRRPGGRWGAAEAERRALVRYGDETALLLPRSATEAQALVARILGPLLRHDAEHGTEHVRTVQVMLRCERSWQLSAAELHIHKQTLGYRIRRIEQLTGRGLARTEDLAEWWFALRAHDLLTGRQLS